MRSLNPFVAPNSYNIKSHVGANTSVGVWLQIHEKPEMKETWCIDSVKKYFNQLGIKLKMKHLKILPLASERIRPDGT